jgi:hypothetical protein
MNCRNNDIAASRAASAALGYQSMLKQWMSERLEQELRERGNK